MPFKKVKEKKKMDLFEYKNGLYIYRRIIWQKENGYIVPITNIINIKSLKLVTGSSVLKFIFSSVLLDPLNGQISLAVS